MKTQPVLTSSDNLNYLLKTNSNISPTYIDVKRNNTKEIKKIEIYLYLQWTNFLKIYHQKKLRMKKIIWIEIKYK